MGEGAGVCNCIFQIIQLGISIAIIVLIVQIYNKTGENPLEKYEKEHPITGNNGVANYIKKLIMYQVLQDSNIANEEKKY